MTTNNTPMTKTKAETEQAEIQRMIDRMKLRLQRVPDSVLRGSHGLAVAYKDAAARAARLIESNRPTLKAASECAADLERFES